MSKDKKLLAVLIDADNVPAKHADDILKEIKTYGEPALRRVYGDWSGSALNHWKDVIHKLGMVAHQVTANTKAKNANDIGLAIDAMDILHSKRFDGFVIVSSDSDFTALANRLREDGVQVIGIGESKAPASLINVCSRFVLIENIIRNVEPELEESKAAAHPILQPGKLIKLIIVAMGNIDPDGEWYSLSAIGNQLVHDNPDFDTRNHGRARLGALVEKLTPFELRKDGGHAELRKAEQAATPKSHTAP
jgi:hypothetical protein